MPGIYLENYNWSAELHTVNITKTVNEGATTKTIIVGTSSQWIMRVRQPSDRVASTPDEISVIEGMAASNRETFKRLGGDNASR